MSGLTGLRRDVLIGIAIGLVAAVVLMLLGVRFGRPMNVRALLIAAVALLALSLLFRFRRR